MTIAVDLGCKATKQTKTVSKKKISVFSITSVTGILWQGVCGNWAKFIYAFKVPKAQVNLHNSVIQRTYKKHQQICLTLSFMNIHARLHSL